MIRVILVTIAAGIIASVALPVSTAVLAQKAPVEQRTDLMRAIGKYVYQALPQMIRGEAPYDQATVDAAFDQLTVAAKELPALFPEGSQTDKPRPPGRTVASPRVWENKADFDARLAAFAKDIAEARPKATGPDGLKAAYPLVRENCNSCHEVYRVRVN